MMVATGVLNSWVILLMKSVFISEIFFWRRIVKIVYVKQLRSTNNSAIEENSITVILPIRMLFLFGKYTASRPDEGSVSSRNNYVTYRFLREGFSWEKLANAYSVVFLSLISKLKAE